MRKAGFGETRWRYITGFFVMAFLTATSCLGQQEGNQMKKPGGISDNTYQLMLEKWKQGIDFYALGNEPFWSLNMDFEGDFHFKTMGGVDLKVPASMADPAADAEVIRFRSATGSGEIIVELIHEKCSDTMSDDIFHYKVKIDYKGTGQSEHETFNGCGNYVPDFRLNDIWAVVEVNGTELNPEDFEKGIPGMEFHIKEEAVSGSDGCNNFRGSFEVQGSSLIFSMLAGTRMFCPNMDKSDQITGAISGQKLDFKFEKDGYLILIKGGERVIKLRHID